MTSNEYRQQLAAIGDAAAAEVDQCERRLSRIKRVIKEQRRRAYKAVERSRQVNFFYSKDLLAKSKLINSILDAIEKELT